MLLIDERLSAARGHRSAGRNDDASLLYESVLDVSPANIPALKELAAIRLTEGRLAEAMDLAVRAASRANNDCEAFALLAKVALLSDRSDVAAVAIEQGLAQDPHHPEINKLKASTLLQGGDQKAAERLLIAALRHHPDDAGLLTALSQMYLEDGLPEPALTYSRKALAQDPDNADLLALVGSQLSVLGSHAEALPYLERAHLRQPANVPLLSYLAETLLSVGQLTEAHRLAKRVVTLMPHLLSGWQTYVKVMAYRGEAEAALAEFVAIAKQHPEKIEAALTLAGAYRIAGNPAQALRLLQPLATKFATLTPTRKMLAMALIRDCCLTLGLFDKVAATFPQTDLHAMLGLTRQGEKHGETDELSAALAETNLVIDGNLSSLDAMVLLRFGLRPPQTGLPTRVLGHSSLADIVALMPNKRFAANDMPEADDRDDIVRALPLSYALALPEGIRGTMTSALPYARAPEERREIWHRSLAGLPRPLIALAWDATRPGLLLDDYRAAFSGFQGTLVSVMWDESRHQLADWPLVIDAGVHFTSMADLAAVIAETDGIIGPNGVPMHMAGAMGAKALLLALPNWPWYWHNQDGVSSWYPSVKVLQTGAIGSWATGIEEIAPAIGEFRRSLRNPALASNGRDQNNLSAAEGGKP
ncbi:tetratricopeptide repeat protein [Rhizobium mayense]|uniref:Tetratricopeptide repeat protein n=1 Tax=Rhizobium mayense TaxID=1312184 RepID=A0ABT7JRF0_9HYPH|nr:tetratricopeptide repeat protein [Rhizobium mayense]MDL2398846.1 tetratricopeptide repeat protein [Rhizobium mayense]